MLRHNKGLEERIGRCDSKEDINANDDCTCIGGLEWHQGRSIKKRISWTDQNGSLEQWLLRERHWIESRKTRNNSRAV